MIYNCLKKEKENKKSFITALCIGTKATASFPFIGDDDDLAYWK